MEAPATIEELQAAVLSLARVRVRGGGTKPALSADATLTTEKLRGIIEYEPSEYTFTAFAGTPLAEIQNELALNGQALPFDPPFVEAGGTLGGTVAAGLSGPGRFRYGGVREFLLGARLVTGEGRIVFGGGKVVKNAAGFDIPKLMVGGLGRMGVLVDLTFKVFPRPEAYATLSVDLPDCAAAHAALTRLAMSQVELTCLDLESPRRLWLRVGGLADALDQRVARIRHVVGDANWQIFSGDDDQSIWSDAREFRWVPDDHSLIKLPIAPAQVLELESALGQLGTIIPRRYSVGGNVAWLAWPKSLAARDLDAVCERVGRTALILSGHWDSVWRGPLSGGAFHQRLLSTFDPASKLAPASA